MNIRRVRNTGLVPILALGILLAVKSCFQSPNFVLVANELNHPLALRHSRRSNNLSVRYATEGEEAKGETTELMLVAHIGDSAKVREAAATGIAVDAQDAYGWTALRYAVRGNHVEASSALIVLGANMNLASESGRTPLMSAAGNGLTAMVKLLLEAGADATVKNKAGQNAYDISLRGGAAGCEKIREMIKAKM